MYLHIILTLQLLSKVLPVLAAMTLPSLAPMALFDLLLSVLDILVLVFWVIGA